MNLDSDLRTKTSLYFDLVNFSELNERWINEVIDNEFTDAEENDISLSILISHKPLQTLKNLADICSEWGKTEDVSNVSRSGMADPSSVEETLWQVLDDIDINVKQIQCFIYLLCDRAKKKDASVEDLLVGLACAKLYFNILTLPGSGACYHPNLFNVCIDCLPAPDFTSDKGSSVENFERLSVIYTSTLLSLIPTLKDFHFGDDRNTIEHAIKKLSELFACDVQNHLQVDVNYLEMGEKELIRRFRLPTIVTVLAYEAFSAILSTDLNGNKDENYLYIVSQLNKYISCYRARKNATVSQKHIAIKSNAVTFICHNLQTQTFCSEATQIAVKRLCLGVVDKNDIRNIVSAAIILILLNLSTEAQIEMIEWFLLLIDSADIKDRVFALDIFGQILGTTNSPNTNLLPESPENDLMKVAIIFAILTRCDDVSPPVRTKALTILSQHMGCILSFLDKTKDHATFDTVDIDDISDKDLDVNGNHRYFWYNLKSFRERLNEIAAILQRRIEDKNVTARKAALLALENLIVFDQTYVTVENLKYFDCATKDANILVRKQVIQTLSTILESYPNNVDIQAIWITCILPLVHDSEATVQSKASSVLEEQFLNKIFSTDQSNCESAFILLKKISSDDFLAHQKYLQKAFGLWSQTNLLKSLPVIQLEKFIGTEWEGCVWFYIANLSMYSEISPGVLNIAVDQFEKFDAKEEYVTLMKYITKILIYRFRHLSIEKSEVVSRVVRNGLNSFTIPVELIPIYIELFCKIYKHCGNESDIATISSSLMQKCEKHLMEISSASNFPQRPSEDLLAKYFSIIKEFCQINASYITPNIILLLKTFSACVKPSRVLSSILSPRLRAHAFAALGKICTQDEILAKDLLDTFASELLSSRHDVIRSNVVIILIEMCKRYTSFADKYLPLICLCFKDNLYLIRYQSIVLVINLLQEGYIKWRGPLFFCLLSTLVDENETIQELGRYSFSQLQVDKKNLFSDHFIDSIFVFNFFQPPDNETVGHTVKDLKRFSMPGEGKREKRMLLYTFLLVSMDFKERAYLILNIRDILTNIAESVYTLNQTTECIVRDIFAILTCEEIRSVTPDQVENVEEAFENDPYKTEINTRKVVIIDQIIPVVVNLKNNITDPESDLMKDLIVFLKEFLLDYKDSLKEILAIDRVLRMQLELEIRNVEREGQEKKTEKEKDKGKPVSADQAQKDPITLQELQTAVEEVTSIIVPDKEMEDGQVNHQTPKNKPLDKSVRQLQKSSKSASSSTNITTKDDNFTQSTYNISSVSPSEAAELHRLASTPRVVLTAVEVPLSKDILNISAIENESEPMNIDESERDV